MERLIERTYAHWNVKYTMSRFLIESKILTSSLHYSYTSNTFLIVISDTLIEISTK